MKKDVKKLNTPQLFLCKVVKPTQKVYPAERQAEIDCCANPLVKAEKYTAWQLLRYAVEHTFGAPFERLNLHKNQNGKWTCDELCFSISHSNELCAVIVDRNPIGVDIQAFEPQRFDKRLLNRIVCEQEKQIAPYKNLIATPTKQLTEQQQKQLLALWCKKEALFKMQDLLAFVAHNVDTTAANFVEMDVDENGNIIAQSSTEQNNFQQTPSTQISITPSTKQNDVASTTTQNTVITSIQQNDVRKTATTQSDTFYHIAIATNNATITTTWVEPE